MASEKHSISFYGLSTCIHCRHCREYLEEKHVPFDLHYIDLAEGEERANLLEKVRKFNPRLSFPTVIIDGDTVVVGFKPEELDKLLGS